MDITVRSIPLADAKLIDLVTYRRDGTGVSTPVLSTPSEDGYLIRTHATAGKLKRLRRDPRVAVTPIDMRRRHVGETEAGTAKILPASQTARCLALIHCRHGVMLRLLTLLRRLRGVKDVFIEVRLA